MKSKKQRKIDQTYLREANAINVFDFDEASEASTMRENILKKDDIKKLKKFEDHLEFITEQNYNNYTTEIVNAKEDYQENVLTFTNLWQNYCKILVKKQRNEANELENEWRQARQEYSELLLSQANTTISSASVLAQVCNQPQLAKDMQDSAVQLLQGQNTPELQRIDIEFTKRYQQMTKRHFAEFDLLHQHLRCLIRNFQVDAKSRNKSAEADLLYDEAFNTSLVAAAEGLKKMSPEVKRKIASEMSPRGKKKENSIKMESPKKIVTTPKTKRLNRSLSPLMF